MRSLFLMMVFSAGLAGLGSLGCKRVPPACQFNIYGDCSAGDGDGGGGYGGYGGDGGYGGGGGTCGTQPDGSLREDC